QKRVVFSLGGRSRDKKVEHPVQVLQAKRGSLYGIVADVLRQYRGIDEGRPVLSAKAQERLVYLAGRPLVQRGFLVFRGLRRGDRLVAPTDGEAVVGSDERKKSFDLVLRLSHVVISPVGHD